MELIGEGIRAQANAQIGHSASREAMMDSNGSGRRRFLKQAAALAGVGVGAGAAGEWAAAQGQSAKPEVQAKDDHVLHDGPAQRGIPARRGVRMSVDHITYYTPLQDYSGIITPSRLQHGRTEEPAVRIAGSFPRMPCQQLSHDP
jgi:hypothetical protein